MKRKINRVGTNTLTVSLPSKWVKRYGLKAGEEVEVLEKGKELKIGIKVREEHKKTELKLESTNDWYISQVIRNLYIAGFDEIKVFFGEKEAITSVQNIVNLLLGFEIVEQGKDFCLIKNLSTGIETELDSLLRKIFLLNKSIFEEAIEQLESKDLNFQRIKDIRDNVHKFASFYRRTITKKKIFGLIKNRAIFIILTRMMMVANNVMYAHRYLNSKKKLPSLKPTIDYLKKVSGLYNIFYDIFYTRKSERLSEMNKIRKELIDERFISLAETHKGENVIACHYYAESVRLIVTNGGAIVKYHSSE